MNYSKYEVIKIQNILFKNINKYQNENYLDQKIMRLKKYQDSKQ